MRTAGRCGVGDGSRGARLSRLGRTGVLAAFPMLLSLVATGCRTERTGAPEGGGRAEPASLALTLENINTQGAGARSVAVSPDGSRLAIAASGPDGAGIYVMAAVSGEGAEGIVDPTFLVEGGSPAWSPDGGRIAYVQDGSLWVVAPEDGTSRALVEGLEGVRDPAWSPDGMRVAFYATESEAQDIWVVPAAGGEPRQLTEEAAALDDSRFTPAWSPDGRRIAYVSNRVDYWDDDVWVVDVEDGAARQVSRGLMASSSPVWSPDGGRIALMGTAKDEYWYQDLAYLYVLEPDTGGERTVRMQVYATDRIMRHRPFWSTNGETLYFPYHERGAFDLWAVPAAGGVATRVTNLGGSWSALDASAPGGRFALVRSGATEGSEVWSVEASGGPVRRLTSFSPVWEGIQEPVEISYRSFDGLYIQGFLFLPPAVREALGTRADGSMALVLRDGTRGYVGPTCPALVQVHGGGTNSNYQGLSLTEQYLASKGYVVYAINYRGGSGFGREFQDLNVEDWLNDQARDPGAAADWLRTLPFVNGEVGIYGGSYGGSMSLAAVTRTPDKFDAAVPMRGAYSKLTTLEYTDRLGKIFTVTGHGGTPEERPEIYAKSNTVDRLDRVQAPLLLMHGERDRRVPIQHFQLAVERLRELGKAFESHTYPTEGHGFRDPANRIDMYSRLEAFFARHLGTCSDR
ncbi:MAG: prolyl oligopeptidase family serine peptidase [Gemmatimonadota bacterium]